MEIRNGLGTVCMTAGDYVGARACGEQALTLQGAVWDCENEGMSLHSIGHVLHRLGTYSEARIFDEQAPAIKYELGIRFYQDGASPYIGLLCHHTGSHQAARENGELGLRIAGEIDDRTAQGWLQTPGAGIHDKELCHLLLENVAAHQDMQPAPDSD